MSAWVRVEQNIAYDIWPQLSALSTITTEELSEILRDEFTPRQAKDLRRELIRLRRAYINLSMDRMNEIIEESGEVR